MGLLERLWRGGYPLTVAFWLFGVIGFPSGLLLSALLLIGVHYYATASFLLFLAPVLFLANSIYIVVVGTGIWRSAARRQSRSLRTSLAQGVVIVGAVFLAASLALTVRMLVVDGDSPETSDTTSVGARDPDPEDRRLAQELVAAPRQAGFWGIDYDEQTGDWRPRLVLAVAKDRSSAKMLEREINSRYPSPKFPGIEFVRIEGNTAYVRVLNGELYTSGMGTTGAEIYSAMITFTFTSLDNISDVCLVGFEEGDHAAPGCRSREHFFSFFGLAKQDGK